VAIGTPAGGIPALKHFFEPLPNKPGIAFAAVSHRGGGSNGSAG